MASCVCVYAKTRDLILLRSCYADAGETEFRSHEEMKERYLPNPHNILVGKGCNPNVHQKKGQLILCPSCTCREHNLRIRRANFPHSRRATFLHVYVRV